MKNLEELRGKLHSVMELGNKEEILKVSQQIDVAILKFLRENKGQALYMNSERIYSRNKM